MNPSNQNAAGNRILTLEEGRALLSLYEVMVQTARAHDWARLTEIEHQAAAIRDAVLASPSVSQPQPDNVEELKALLIQIQRLDHEIRSQVEPAREEARQQLAAEVKGRTVRTAYGGATEG
ncbi:MAG: flagellar protein FliT [Azoarcus sp.]|jgi:flagellar protein FliT|nr:flagellar protein FliT [Azoarcus sp.]